MAQVPAPWPALTGKQANHNLQAINITSKGSYLIPSSILQGFCWGLGSGIVYVSLSSGIAYLDHMDVSRKYLYHLELSKYPYRLA